MTIFSKMINGDIAVSKVLETDRLIVIHDINPQAPVHLLIITKTPYRISFFGGGSDYPEWYKKYGGMDLFQRFLSICISIPWLIVCIQFLVFHFGNFYPRYMVAMVDPPSIPFICNFLQRT